MPLHQPRRHRILEPCLALVSLLFLFGAAHAESHDYRYLDIREYLQLHPEQTGIMAAFNERVQSPAAPLPEGSHDGSVRIAIIYPGEQISDYWQRSVTALTRRLNEYGIAYDIHEYTSKPIVDRRLQEEQLRDALAADPDYLVFTLNVARHTDLIERMLSSERPKIILQNITTPLERWEGRQPFLYVGFDHATGARMLAEEYLHRVGHDPDYAVLYYSEGYISDMRGNTFVAAMAAETGRMPRAEFFTDNMRERTEDATRRILERSTPDFIYACSTDIALAAASVLQEAGLSGKVLLNGWGGGSPELSAMDLGMIDFTVMRMNDDNGVAMADAIVMDQTGQGEAVPQVFSGGFAIVDRDTDPATLERLRDKAFRYSGR